MTKNRVILSCSLIAMLVLGFATPALAQGLAGLFHNRARQCFDEDV